ncbi:PrgI family mobile element protein [Nocardia sp. NPDC058658]|uniref:TraG/VirB4 family ATPase n=1 Tax=Nocardia sp. NPDC058658 TaxID=3346580 RepID=UPI0036564138
MTTRIPADVDRPDRLVGPFTARQLAILAALVAMMYLAWTATRSVIPAPVFIAFAIPLGTAVAVTALTTRHGLSGDKLLLAAIRHRTRPRHLVSAPEGIGKVPRWLTASATGKHPDPRPLSSDAVTLPETVTPGGDGIGVIDLGAEGLAMIAAAGTVNLALHTPEEQDSLVAQLGRWLHSLSQPVQILLRSTRLDLTGHINGLRTAAEAMSPELATAATDHADHLAGMARDELLLRRQVLLVWRETLDLPTGAGASLTGPSSTAIASWLLGGRRRARRQLSDAARRAAESRLQRRISEATDLLAPLGITVTALDHDQATSILTSATHPGSLVPDTADTDDHHRDDVVHIGEAETFKNWAFSRRVRTTGGRGTAGFAPESLTIGARHLEVGAGWVATLAITGFPREVGPAWLAPLLSHPGRLDVAVHIEPVDAVTAATRLRKQLARLESSRNTDFGHGRLADQQVEVAVEDATDLSSRIARGQGRLFRTGVYVTVHADSEAELADEAAAVRALAASLLIDTCPLTYRATQGWTATLPLGMDPVRVRRTFDTDALAAAFPFNSPQLPAIDPVANRPAGVLLGRDAAGGLMFWDRFAPEVHNHNAIVLGVSGSGKSYLLKAELLRSLHRGIENIVIDPEDEYRRLSDAVGGTYVHLGAKGVRLNPFDLEIHIHPDGHRAAPADAFTRRKLFAHTVIAVILGQQTPTQRALLDTALTAAYSSVGITDDPATWGNPAPTMSILREQLLALDSPVGADIAAALAPYTGTGAFAGLIDGPTTTVPDGGLVVLSLRELPEELKTIGTLLALDVTARRVANPATRRPRQVTVDEAWLLMRQPIGAEFLLKAAKSFRKSWAGLTVATQDCADVLSTDIGKAIVANSATQILLRQASQAIDEVAGAFKLSDGERTMLLTAGRGVGLLSTGTHRAAFATLASAVENALITSDPNEIAATDAGVDENDYVALSNNVIDDADAHKVSPAEPADDGPDGEDVYIDLRDAA